MPLGEKDGDPYWWEYSPDGKELETYAWCEGCRRGMHAVWHVDDPKVTCPHCELVQNAPMLPELVTL
jgi:hypothetical protein